ncbi:hypothetical protein J9874_02399 [Duffyella gerundensis]|uniref:DUF6024 family protein n=1 Tax=Duffyella gerundensis TaxID=1619313 RepID=UPI001CE30D2E|nr:DUF6024 family protein [Duffyella gerundensis]UCB31847.1 hypothetical protein J9874_02399 [Duffyella gerundensis]
MHTRSDKTLSARHREKQCHQLRLQLSRLYKLDRFDLFFMPSQHVARLILSQLMIRQEAMNRQRRQFTFAASELQPSPRCLPPQTDSIAIIEHVSPLNGKVTAPDNHGGQGVIDASESFATLLHGELVEHGQLFITTLGSHAALTHSLVLVALRTCAFSTWMRSELRLFEQSLVKVTAVEAALQRIASRSWQPYNVARVAPICLEQPLLVRSVSAPGLPFSCIPLTPAWGSALALSSGDGFYCRERGLLHLAASARGDGSQPVTMTEALTQRLQRLLLAAAR